MGTHRLPIGLCENRVRRRLDPDNVGVGGGRAGLVVLGHLQAPRLELRKRHTGAEVRTLGEGDLRARPAEREDARGHCRRAGGIEQSVATLELTERTLGLGAGRVRVTLVDERAGFTGGVVGPHGAAVDRSHDVTLESRDGLDEQVELGVRVEVVHRGAHHLRDPARVEVETR